MLELLAPAGSMEALRAAVQNGADAVYLGVGPFNARQGARNFTVDTLREAVKYAHIRGAAVHLTLNTLVSDREAPQAAELIRAGRVMVNHRPQEKGDKLVEEGDTLTCRGLGKCVLTAIGGTSKRGRIILTLARYI